MPTTVTNPLSGLIDGMLQGYGLGMQLKREKMQQEAHQRAIASQDREAQVKDIQTQMMLGQNARPVNAGTVQDQLMAAPEIPGQPKMEGGNPQIPIVRPVDKSRRVSYKGRDGQAQEYELLTPSEQIARQMQGLDAKAEVDRRHKRTLRQDELEDTGIDVPGYGRVLPGASDDVVRMLNILNPRPPVPIPGRDIPYAPEVEEQRKRITSKPTPKIPGRDVPYSPDVEAQRTRMGTARRDSPTANGQGVENRFQQRQLENDQKTLRDLETKEAKLHAEKLETGQMSPGKGDDAKAFPDKRNARLSALDLQIKGIQESKKKLIDKWQPKGGMQTQTQAPKQLTDPAVARQYLEKAGGDKEKARKLAAADNWTF